MIPERYNWTPYSESDELSPKKSLEDFLREEKLSYAAGDEGRLVNEDGKSVARIYTVQGRRYLFFLLDGGYLIEKAESCDFLKRVDV